MQRRKRRAKPGFALLEAMVFVILMLLLGAAMLGAAYNMHRRSLERAENDRAYNAAVAALKMVGDSIAGGESPDRYLAENSYTLDVTPEGETAAQAFAQVVIKGQKGTFSLGSDSYEGVRLTAAATVAGETETVQLTLQKAKAEPCPHTLFGAGFAGSFTASQHPTLTLGPDTDLYLYGFPGAGPVEFTGLTVGGNLIAQGVDLTLRDSSVAGSVVGSGALTLENTLVGGRAPDPAAPSADPSERLSNVYSLTSAALGPGAQISGDVYAPLVSSRGSVRLLGGHSIYCADRQLDQFTVFDAAGGGHLTTDQDLSRTGTLTFEGAGRWKALPGALESPFPGADPLPMFVPNFPVTIPTTVVSANQTASSAPATDEGVLYRVQNDRMLTLTGASPGPGNAPATFVVLGEKSTLYLSGAGPFYLYVYGQGPDKECTVKVPSGAVICGSLQGVTLDFTESSPGGSFELTLQAMQPTRIEYQTPASAGYSRDVWRVVGYERVSPS